MLLVYVPGYSGGFFPPGSDGPVQRSRTLTLAPPYTLAPAVWAHCILPLFCSNDSCPRAQTIISLTCPDFLSAWCVVQAQEYVRLRTVHGSEEVYHSKWQAYSDTDFKRQYIKYNQELIKQDAGESTVIKPGVSVSRYVFSVLWTGMFLVLSAPFSTIAPRTR